MVVYGGDDVSALVLDIGEHTVRAGYAGDDAPKAVFPTTYAYRDTQVPGADPSAPLTSTRKLWIGERGAPIWKPNQEVANPFHNGILEDFNPVPEIIKHAFVDNLRCDPADHPVLLTESAWNTPANRERMAEILFEEFKVPAFYTANSGVLTAFGAGRGTALVVDVGSHYVNVIPVVDGFVLRKGLQRSNLPVLARLSATNFLGPSPRRQQPVALIPHQLIATKAQVDFEQPPNVTYREDRMAFTTASWKTWAMEREKDEWIATVGAVLENGWGDHQHVAMRPPKIYEFTSGFSTSFSQERYYIGEAYFDQRHMAQANPNLPPTIPALIQHALAGAEADLRAHLIQNVVLTGGSSLMMGFTERLSNELGKMYAGKAKLYAPGNIIERQYGAWVGGSILASLGTFHQLWISRAEWQEHGKAIISQRCK